MIEVSAKIGTCIYNATDEMFEMLRVFLYSGLGRTDAELLVYWNGLSKSQVDAIKSMSCRISLAEAGPICQSSEHAASKKIGIWRQIAWENRVHDLMLADFDMLFVGNPTPTFPLMESFGVDLFFTVKDNPTDKFPVNTGVVFVSKYASASKFFAEWEKGVKRLIGDPAAAETAVEKFGALDQAWIADLIIPEGRGHAYGCEIQTLKSSVFNLHKDWSRIPDDCRMIHYKSTWPSALLRSDKWEEALQSPGWSRPEVRSWEPCFRAWRNVYNEMKEEENARRAD